uniref:Retrotransposon Copia-like N-terminal domain-containing protein n=1 Tax=Cucumis melo TaxID=3656 RepID=A0A9I9CTV4_CUCME
MGTEASFSSSTSKELSSPLFLLTNICNLISIRLDSTNYTLWKFQFEPMLKALYGFIDESFPTPPKTISNSTTVSSSTTTQTTSSSTTELRPLRLQQPNSDHFVFNNRNQTASSSTTEIRPLRLQQLKSDHFIFNNQNQ